MRLPGGPHLARFNLERPEKKKHKKNKGPLVYLMRGVFVWFENHVQDYRITGTQADK